MGNGCTNINDVDDDYYYPRRSRSRRLDDRRDSYSQRSRHRTSRDRRDSYSGRSWSTTSDDRRDIDSQWSWSSTSSDRQDSYSAQSRSSKSDDRRKSYFRTPRTQNNHLETTYYEQQPVFVKRIVVPPSMRYPGPRINAGVAPVIPRARYPGYQGVPEYFGDSMIRRYSYNTYLT